MILFSLVIPCFNEAENIPTLLDRCKQSFIDQNIEIILVDNGSWDDTPAVLRRLLPDYPFARTTRVEKNQGYGFGILSGLAVAEGQYVGWTHADLQTDPRDVLLALELIKVTDQPLFLKGRRYGRKITDLIFTVSMSVFESLLLKMGLWDINAQPNIMPKDFYRAWKNPPHDFSLDLYTYYRAKVQGLKIVRFPVFFGKRTAGEAHLKNLKAKLKYSLRTIRYSLQLKNNIVN